MRFSAIEVRHLLLAVLALTAAFTLFLAPGDLNDPQARLQNLVADPLLPIAAFVAAILGFLLHELAHKVVAQAYGHWAEFRANAVGLGGAVAVAALLKIILAAPGAVLISGRVTPQQHGIISLVGPGVNMVIAAATVWFAKAVDQTQPLPIVMGTIAVFNALLGAFNMLPLGPLDGRKVWRWNKAVYVAALLVAVGILVLAFQVAQPTSTWADRITPAA